MPRMTLSIAEETLRKEVHKLDKRVQLLAVNETKKKDAYRVTLLKDGRTGSASIKKDLVSTSTNGPFPQCPRQSIPPRWDAKYRFYASTQSLELTLP
jgi:hypothetical protein